MKKNIWTVGHSNLDLEVFIQILKSFNIQTLVDIRRFPGSRKFPHFNKENLQIELLKEDIDYLHLESLGGRRKPKSDSKNTGWNNDAFRGYADYMETEEFSEAIDSLMKLAVQNATAIMCSEVLYWRCHRMLISDHLKKMGWSVTHIMGLNKSKEHTYSAVAKASLES
jgi:uncharacterized protein (DUF488 family)